MPKLNKPSKVSKWYIADANDGTNSTFRTMQGAKNYLNKHKGGKVIVR